MRNTLGRSLPPGGVQNQALEEEPKQERERQIEDKRDEEGEPPSNVFLRVGRSNAHEATDVDHEVEPEHYTLSGRLGVLDDTLTVGEGDDGRDGVGDLVEKEGRHIGLEHGGTNRQDVDGEEVWGLGRTSEQEIPGTGTNHEDVGDTEHGHTPADDLEAAPFGIGKPAEEERQTVGQHAERLSDGIGDLGAHSQGTTSLLIARGVWRSTPAIATSGQWPVDVVADERLDTVVGSALAELDDTDHVGDDGNISGYAAEGGQLLLGRLALVPIIHDGRVKIGGVAVPGRSVRHPFDIITSRSVGLESFSAMERRLLL